MYSLTHLEEKKEEREKIKKYNEKIIRGKITIFN